MYVTRATADDSYSHSLAVARRLVTVLDHYKEADVNGLLLVACWLIRFHFCFSKDVGR